MTVLVKLLLLVVLFFFPDSDKVSEFRQSVRQILSWIQTIALPTLYRTDFLERTFQSEMSLGKIVNMREVPIPPGFDLWTTNDLNY